MTNIRRGEGVGVNIPPVEIKRHTFNSKHYLLSFEKFIEQIGFVELSTQAKHLRTCILHDD